MITANPQLLRFVQTQFSVAEDYEFGSISDLESNEFAETLETILVGSLLYIKKAMFNDSAPVWQRKIGTRSVSFDRILFFQDPHSGTGRNVFGILSGRGNNDSLFSDNPTLRVSFKMFISTDLILLI